MAEKEGGAIMAEDMCEARQCSYHPYRSNPGGICAFCLQEKLGKLLSSSISSSDPFPLASPPPSSYSPPSFSSSSSSSHLAPYSSTRISFLSMHRRRKKTPTSAADVRSDSLASALGGASAGRRKNSFWSFLTTSYSSAAIPSSFSTKRRSTSSSSSVPDLPKDTPRREKVDAPAVVGDCASPSGSQAYSSFVRKVSRSRSVGCGSRSFSGDFLERISNGFGDCTLRRVESHREAKPKAFMHRHGDGDDDVDQRIKERAKCGGIFVGLGLISSFNYWLSATATATADAFEDIPGRLPATRRGATPNGRSRSWVWALASPMRALRPGGGRKTAIFSAGGGAVGGWSHDASRVAAAGKPSTVVLI